MRAARWILLWMASAGSPAADAEVADSLPRIEAGVGAAALFHPHYRGAKGGDWSGFPLPYVLYRGEVLRVDRDGIKAMLFGDERWRLTMSVAASLPGGEGRDSPRAGMEKLLPTFEAGPSLDWIGDRGPSGWRWRIRIPARAVLATDLRDFESAGWVLHPNAQFDRVRWDDAWWWRYGVGAGPLWADRRHHVYFYEVAPADTAPGRPVYRAGAGYGGLRGSAFLAFGRGPWRFGLGVLADWLSGAAFEDSPLVESRRAVVVGAGVSYRLWRSEEVVRSEDR